MNICSPSEYYDAVLFMHFAGEDRLIIGDDNYKCDCGVESWEKINNIENVGVNYFAGYELISLYINANKSVKIVADKEIRFFWGEVNTEGKLTGRNTADTETDLPIGVISVIKNQNGKNKIMSIYIDEEEEDPIDVDEGEKNPIDVDEEEEDPIDVDEEEEDPIDVDEEEEYPIDVDEDEEDPIDVDEDEEDPIDVDEEEEDPIDVDEDEEDPIDVDKGEKNPIDVDEDEEDPIDEPRQKGISLGVQNAVLRLDIEEHSASRDSLLDLNRSLNEELENLERECDGLREEIHLTEELIEKQKNDFDGLESQLTEIQARLGLDMELLRQYKTDLEVEALIHKCNTLHNEVCEVLKNRVEIRQKNSDEAQKRIAKGE